MEFSRTRSLWIGAAVLLVAGLVALAAIRGLNGGGDAGSGKAVLIVGDQRGGAQALLEAAGELKNVPYRIQWALFPAASPLLEALDAGAVDVGGIGGAPFAFAYASGAKIKAITAYRVLGAGAGKASAIVVSANSPLRTVADLKGKRVATIRGSAGQDLVLKLLERAKIDPKDIRWTYLANGESKAALSTGSVDAWSTWGSYVGIALLKDGDRLLADGTGVPLGAGFYAASDTAIAGKAKLLEDYVARLARARKWARSHSDDYAAVLARETDIPFDVARFTVGASQGTAIAIDDALVGEQKQIFQRYRAAGIIPSVPDLSGAYDPRFNAAVMRAIQ